MGEIELEEHMGIKQEEQEMVIEWEQEDCQRMVMNENKDHAGLPFERDQRIVPEDRGIDGEYTIQFRIRDKLGKYMGILISAAALSTACLLMKERVYSHIYEGILMVELAQWVWVTTLWALSKIFYHYRTYSKNHRVILRGILLGITRCIWYQAMAHMLPEDYLILGMVVQVSIQLIIRQCIKGTKSNIQLVGYLVMIICYYHLMLSSMVSWSNLLMVVLQILAQFIHDVLVVTYYSESYTEQLSLYNLMDECFMSIQMISGLTVVLYSLIQGLQNGKMEMGALIGDQSIAIFMVVGLLVVIRTALAKFYHLNYLEKALLQGQSIMVILPMSHIGWEQKMVMGVAIELCLFISWDYQNQQGVYQRVGLIVIIQMVLVALMG